MELKERVVKVETEIVDIKKDTAKIDDLIVNSAVVVEGIAHIKGQLEELNKIDELDKRVTVVETDVKATRRHGKWAISIIGTILTGIGIVIALL